MPYTSCNLRQDIFVFKRTCSALLQTGILCHCLSLQPQTSMLPCDMKSHKQKPQCSASAPQGLSDLMSANLCNLFPSLSAVKLLSDNLSLLPYLNKVCGILSTGLSTFILLFYYYHLYPHEKPMHLSISASAPVWLGSVLPFHATRGLLSVICVYCASLPNSF